MKVGHHYNVDTGYNVRCTVVRTWKMPEKLALCFFPPCVFCIFTEK